MSPQLPVIQTSESMNSPSDYLKDAAFLKYFLNVKVTNWHFSKPQTKNWTV